MQYHCEAIQQPAQPVLFIRTKTTVQDLPQVLGRGYGAIMQFLEKAKEQPVGPPFVAYYNMDMSDLDIELGFPVSSTLAGKEPIQAGSIPACQAASCEFTGPYPELGLAYEELTTWIRENGHAATGVVYEFYLNDPMQTPAEELKTKIMFLLKK